MTRENILFNYAVWLLARRSYHTAELRKKMEKEKRATPEEIEKVITQLQLYKYIDDQKYLHIFIRDQQKRKAQGVRLVKQTLLKRGIPKSEIESALIQEVTPESELIQAQKAAQKKCQKIKADDPQQKKQKLYRFLISRGFSQDTITKILPSLEP